MSDPKRRYFERDATRQPAANVAHTKRLSTNDFTDYYKDLIDNLFVPILDEAGNILTDERGQYLIEE